MKDVADETTHDAPPVLEADPVPVILHPDDEPTDTQECEYCGHFPCGCGG